MKILFDALGSTARSGGMRLHSTELLIAWCECFPQDDLSIVCGDWAREEFAGYPVSVHVWPNEHVGGRFAGQFFDTALQYYIQRPDFVVSLSPIVTPFVPRDRRVCFQHDWRHKKNPDEFPLPQRAYRRLWSMSAHWAAATICISQKTVDETERYARGASTILIENGRDHARRWPTRRDTHGRPYLVTYGHHNNKRPELVIDALPILEKFTKKRLDLVILGTGPEYAQQLHARAASRGVSDRVFMPGFVEEAKYQEIIENSSLVALVSSDEGFGLPIAEAQFLGIPAVVTSDSGMSEIFDRYPTSAEPSADGIARSILSAMSRPGTERSGILRSWRDAAMELRTHLQHLRAAPRDVTATEAERR